MSASRVSVAVRTVSRSFCSSFLSLSGCFFSQPIAKESGAGLGNHGDDKDGERVVDNLGRAHRIGPKPSLKESQD